MGLALLNLDGKRALVTGGGVGLGHHMALGLAEAGADLVVCGRRRELLEQCAAEAREFGRDVTVIPADITREEDLQVLLRDAGHVDILLNNAGIGLLRPWDKITREEWHSVTELNVDALFRLCQLFAPPMLERGWGRIINVSSVYGLISGDPNRYPADMQWDNPAYVVSKHAPSRASPTISARASRHAA